MANKLQQCKKCANFHTGGVKDGAHNNWCCKFGKSAIKAIGECKLKNGFVLKGEKK